MSVFGEKNKERSSVSQIFRGLQIKFGNAGKFSDMRPARFKGGMTIFPRLIILCYLKIKPDGVRKAQINRPKNQEIKFSARNKSPSLESF